MLPVSWAPLKPSWGTTHLWTGGTTLTAHGTAPWGIKLLFFIFNNTFPFFKNRFPPVLICKFCFFVSGSSFLHLSLPHSLWSMYSSPTLAAPGLCKAYIIQTSMYLCLREIVVAKAAGRRPLTQRGITTGNSLFPLQQEEIATFKHLNPTRRHPLQSH